MALPTTARPGTLAPVGAGAPGTAPGTAPAPPGRGRSRLPRALHPVAWWAWALGLMVAAARTTNPLLLGTILGVLALVVAARRPDAPWAGAFAAALRLGAVVVVARTLLQLLLGPPIGIGVAFRLPELALPDWMAGIRLGGIVTWESLYVGLCEGLRLAVMIACAGAANALSAPSRLLRSVPAALYELGVAVVVALTFAPHLLDDARRVRAARRLRGHEEGRLRGFARASGPVLDGALERSIQLAAAMDSRGYGRAGTTTVGERRVQAGLVLAGFAGVLVGLYGLFDASAPRWLGWPLLAAGALVALLGLRAAGRRSTRTAYRPDPWRLPEWATAASGVLVAVAFATATWSDLAVAVTPLAWPAAAVLPLATVLLAAGPAVWTPPLPALGRWPA
ncbi:MAG: energy-coupling factor transporter transmembrane protein EcfT [Candidatus Nanopelagicales bacterium]|nr:energy-coupling factor transporter transmembrane protein EcfT [Candidatus Nanopelagicales bacterium]